MIVMMMSVEYRDELQVFLAQIVQYRYGVTRVDHGGMIVVSNNPDIIVGECAERNDMRHSHGKRQVELWENPNEPLIKSRAGFVRRFLMIVGKTE
jgi:hypothetical protein